MTADRPAEGSETAASLRSRSALHLIMATAALLTLLTILTAGVTTWRLRVRIEAETKAAVQRLALVVAEQTGHSFQSIDIVLRDLQREAVRPGISAAELPTWLSSKALHDVLVRQSGGLEQAGNLIVIGADGNLLNISLSWPAPPMMLSGREQFRHLRDHDQSEPFVSEPVINRLDGSWTVYVARRLNDTSGNFAGIVQAAVRLKHFEDFYESVSLGEGGSIALSRLDGVLLASFPILPGEIGKKREEPLDGNPADVIMRRQKVAAAEDRFVTRKPVSSVPLLVSVSLSREVALRGWRGDAILLLGGSIGAIVGIILLLAVLGRKIRKMRASEVVLAEQNAELRRSRKLLLEAQRVGKFGHWTCDLDSEALVWSPQLFAIAGLPPAPQVPLETAFALVHPDDLAEFVRERTRAVREDKEFAHQHRWVRPDGTVRWIRLKSGVQMTADGRVAGRFGIVQDITEQKQAEQAAEESSSRLHDAIESVPQGFVLYDKDDRFVLANTHFREMFPELLRLMRRGTRFEEFLRGALAAEIFDVPAAEREEWISQALASHFAGSRPIERRTKAGRWIQFLDHRTGDGGIAGVCTDITSFKDIEAALEQRLADLEVVRGDLEQRKEELEATAANLTVAKNAAEAANRAKSDFLAIMSHEIRTPLSGMMGMIDLLDGSRMDVDQQRYANLAKESADALLDVVNNILDFSKLEAHQLQLEVIDFELRPLLRGVVALMMTKAQEKGLRLDLECDEGVPEWVKGEPGRIRQVLLNLVSNAIKFTAVGEVRVRVDHELQLDRKERLRFSIADTGIGIAPDVQKLLFEPFVQADTSIARAYGGSGLGLAICKQLCAVMGGEVGLESSVGSGSTFWFTVLCEPGVSQVVEPTAPIAPVIGELQILVAEDSPIIATLISSLLHSKGFQADMAANGAVAVNMASDKRYDVILMDIQMPKVDGIAATEAIRGSRGPNADTPIIALTANALVGQKEKYLAAGMNAYVTKPIQPKILFQTIEDISSGRLPVRPTGEATSWTPAG